MIESYKKEIENLKDVIVSLNEYIKKNIKPIKENENKKENKVISNNNLFRTGVDFYKPNNIIKNIKDKKMIICLLLIYIIIIMIIAIVET